MKKYLIGFLLFITACLSPLEDQTATQTPLAESTPTETLLPSPIPATATQTLTPAPTLTPTPIPLYFTEEFNSPDTTPWTSFQTGGESTPTLAIENGLLRFDLTSSHTWYYAIHNAHQYQDVTITAKFSGPLSGSTGLICRHSESGWLEFNIASNGTYSVLFGQQLSDGIANYFPIASDPIEYLTPDLMDYEIGLICQENFLSLIVNGKLFRKLDVSRFALTEGKVGISTASFGEGHSIITYEWFKVSEPE